MRVEAIWQGVDRLIDRAPTLADIRSHRIELLAARRWRAQGLEIPRDFVELERRSAITKLVVPRLLERVRAACDSPMIVHKGPEVAAHYPDPILRNYGDVDLLVLDADQAQRALLSAGFEEIGDPKLYVDIQHLRPLQHPDIPLRVEIHSRPKWVESLTPPSIEALFSSAVPSTVTDGFLALPPEHHALLLAVHSWAHEPLRRLRDVIDIAAVASATTASEVAKLAQSWGLSRLWWATDRAVAAVLADGPRPVTVRVWGRNLALVRERTVIENHLQRWLSDFAVLPIGRAALGLPRTVRRELGTEGDERWSEKATRTGIAVRNAFRRRSEHDEELER